MIKAGGRGFRGRLKGCLTVLGLVLSLLAILPGRGSAAPSSYELPEGGQESGRVLLLIMDRLTPEELFKLAGPRLEEIMEGGSLGLLNSRTAGREGSSAYLTLGAGARAKADLKGDKAFRREEVYRGVPAEEIYRRNLRVEPEGEFLHPYLHYLKEINRELNYRVTPGLLGEALKREGLQAAVVGNADTDTPRRAAVLTVMDRSGSVDLGVPGAEVLREDPLFPYGTRTDGLKAAGAVNDLAEQASLIAVEWGDSTRLDEWSPYMTPAALEASRRHIFEELELFLESITLTPDRETLFALVVPSAPLRHRGSGSTLLPVVLSGGAYTPGLLTSPTTRRDGLAANIDLAATLLQHLNIPRVPGTGGTAMTVVEHDRPAEHLLSLSRRAALVHDQRPLFLRPYVLAQILILFGSLPALSLFFKRFRRVVVALLELSMLVPLLFLLLALLPGAPYPSPLLSAFFLLLMSGLLLAGLSLVKKRPNGRVLSWVILGLAISAALSADLLAGAPLQKYSFFGYDLVSGSRYYGLGNEYMGVLIGATVLGGASCWKYLQEAGLFTPEGSGAAGKASPKGLSGFLPRRFPPQALLLLLMLYYLAVVLVIGSPSFGANVGGAISAAAAVGAALVFAVRSGPGKNKGSINYRLYPAAALFMALLALFWYYYLNRETGPHWHLQALWDQWMAGGLEEVQTVFHRKISMNLQLIRYSIWTRVLLVFIGVLAVLFFYPVGAMKRFREQEGHLYRGVTAVMVGAVAALLVNDSGVVAAATTLLYGVPPMLVHFLEEGSG